MYESVCFPKTNGVSRMKRAVTPSDQRQTYWTVHGSCCIADAKADALPWKKPSRKSRPRWIGRSFRNALLLQGRGGGNEKTKRISVQTRQKKKKHNTYLCWKNQYDRPGIARESTKGQFFHRHVRRPCTVTVFAQYTATHSDACNDNVSTRFSIPSTVAIITRPYCSRPLVSTFFFSFVYAMTDNNVSRPVLYTVGHV